MCKRIKFLEKKVIVLESRIRIAENVNTLLKKKIDNQESYSRRLFLIMSGIKKSRNENPKDLKTELIENLKEVV